MEKPKANQSYMKFSPSASSGSETPRLSKGDGVDPRKTPEWYLQLVKKCSLKVQDIISPGSNTSPKFNYEQCKYLADKLASDLTGVESFLRIFRVKCGDGDMTKHADIFKFFLSLALEVETFIQGCCKDAWIQAALTLANMCEHVTLLGFNLELCRVVFLVNNDEWTATQKRTVDEVAQMSELEVKTVKTGADRDMKILLKMLEDAKMSPSGKSRGEDVLLATVLLERLKRGISIGQGSNIGESSSKVPTDSQPSESSRSDDRRSSQIYNDLEQRRSLGKGSFGSHVHEAIWFGAQVAMKTFFGLDHPDFSKEMSFLERCFHSNVMSLFCWGQNQRKCTSFLVMEFMDGDLFALIQERMRGDGSDESPPFNIFEAIDLMSQIAAGMNYLYENRVLHRDLKSGNIFFKRVKDPESNIEYVHVKVGDFGLSKTKERSRTYSELEPNMGTTRWMAPELMPTNNGLLGWFWSFLGIQTQRLPFKCDVYSFALVCYEILSGYMPFSTISTDKDVRMQVLAGQRPQLLSGQCLQLLSGQCPAELKTLIENCWNGNPSKRPSFVEICTELRYLKYQFLTSFVQDMQKTKEIDPDLDHARNSQVQDVLQMRHKIFLSHSGVQKHFVEHLVVALEHVDRYPFFDQRPNSVPKGFSFPAVIFEAISQARVGVVILSEEYLTRSKWAMLELTTMVKSLKQNPEYKILPVFYGITSKEFNDPENHKRWLLVWADWANRDSRIILKEWMAALTVVCGINGLSFHSVNGEVAFRRAIVEAICRIVPPATDDSHTDSRTGGADEHSD